MDDPRSAEILDIIAKETGVDRARLSVDAVISDLDIASLDLVQAIFAIEEREQGGFRSCRSAPGGVPTVGDMVQHVLATLEAVATEPLRRDAR